MELPFAEAWKIKMVEPIRKSTRQEREQWLKEAHYNVFQLKSEQVYIVLITGSGTRAMGATARPWNFWLSRMAQGTKPSSPSR